jgi:hypothetical protein
MLERFEIQTVREEAIGGAFALARPAFVRAVARARGHEAAHESRECERIGRVFLEGLHPETRYTVSFFAGDEELAERVVATLPRPVGRKRAEYFIIADPHLTRNRETRRGRLFPESAGILREAIGMIRPCQPDFVVMPGDVTDGGHAEECALAKEVLGELPCPVLMVPGDHDSHEGRRHYRETFGSGRWVAHHAGMTLIGCEGDDLDHDPTGRCLGRAGVEHLLAGIEAAEGPVVLVSHRQFVPDDYIVDDDRAYADHELFVDHVLLRLPAGTIAYIGHKNAPARYQVGNLTQLNCPQPVQYPCGLLRVRCYENGAYHTFEPIFSEVLNDFSRVTGSALGSPLWQESYRRGPGPERWNFVSEGR